MIKQLGCPIPCSRFLITLWQLKALEINKLSVKYKINLTIKKSDVDSHKIIIYIANDYQ